MGKLSKSISSLTVVVFSIMALMTWRGDGKSVQVFRAALAVYSLLMIVDETMELQVNKTGKRTSFIAGIAILGYMTFLTDSYMIRAFIGGNICLIGSFLITLSPLLKMLELVVERQKTIDQIKKSPLRCLKLISRVIIGMCLFLIAAGTSFMAEHLNESVMGWMVAVSYLVALSLHLSVLYCQMRSQQQNGPRKISAATQKVRLNNQVLEEGSETCC